MSLSRPIVLLQDLSSCRMTHRGHEVPVFTVQSPALNVVPLLPRVAEQYPHKFQMLCIAAASKANRPDGHWDYFCRPSRHRACAKHLCVCRIHKVYVCVCTRMYTCTCSHLRTYPFPRLVKKNAILRIVYTGDDIGRTPADAQIASSSEDRCTCYFYARPQCLNNSPRASSEHSIAT